MEIIVDGENVIINGDEMEHEEMIIDDFAFQMENYESEMENMSHWLANHEMYLENIMSNIELDQTEIAAELKKSFMEKQFDIQEQLKEHENFMYKLDIENEEMMSEIQSKIERDLADAEDLKRQLEEESRILEQHFERKIEHDAEAHQASLDFVEVELLRDGLIEDRNSYRFEITDKYFKVNKKKQSKKLHKKYIRLIERANGKSLGKKFKHRVHKNS